MLTILDEAILNYSQFLCKYENVYITALVGVCTRCNACTDVGYSHTAVVSWPPSAPRGICALVSY